MKGSSDLPRRNLPTPNRNPSAAGFIDFAAGQFNLLAVKTAGQFINGFIRLDQLPPRVCAVVREITIDDEEMQRLKTLGVCLGRRVELVKAGDPLILKVFGSRLGLSAALASHVHVEVCEPDHCALREDDCK
jgi:Fe2+ transport system protein FeoA